MKVAVYQVNFNPSSKTWIEEFILIDGIMDAEFGSAVALDGDAMAVGAPKEGADGFGHIYRRSTMGNGPWDQYQMSFMLDPGKCGDFAEGGYGRLAISCPGRRSGEIPKSRPTPGSLTSLSIATRLRCTKSTLLGSGRLLDCEVLKERVFLVLFRFRDYRRAKC